MTRGIVFILNGLEVVFCLGFFFFVIPCPPQGVQIHKSKILSKLSFAELLLFFTKRLLEKKTDSPSLVDEYIVMGSLI